MSPVHRNIDWAATRLAYETKSRSIRALASDHHLSEGAIRKRAKAEEWIRAPLPRCEPRTEAERAREKRERAKRGERVERVVLKPGQAVLIVDVGEMGDCLGVPEWSREDPTIVVPLIDEELKRLVRTS